MTKITKAELWDQLDKLGLLGNNTDILGVAAILAQLKTAEAIQNLADALKDVQPPA